MKATYSQPKKMTIDTNHFSFKATKDVKEICYDFFQKTGLKYFYFSHYNLLKNEAIVLTASPDINRYILALHGYPKQTELEAGIHYLPSHRSSYERAEIGKRFNQDQTLEMITVLPEHIELFGFATYRNQPEQLNFYFNNLETLRTFAQYFKETAQGLIQKAWADPIALTSPLTNLIKLEKFKKNFSYNHFNFSLTPQELKVLTALSQGATSKEIGQLLHLSHRTVEAYLANVKIKSGIHNKAQLLKFIFENHI